MLAMFDFASNRQWTEAIFLQKLAALIFDEAIQWIADCGEGIIDPVFDKGLAISAGCFVGSQRTPSPFIGRSDETVSAFRDLLQNHFPQLLFGQEPVVATEFKNAVGTPSESPGEQTNSLQNVMRGSRTAKLT